MISFIKISFIVLWRYRVCDYRTALFSSNALMWQLGTWLRTTFEGKGCYNLVHRPFFRQNGSLLYQFQCKCLCLYATESNKALHLSEYHLADE